MIGFFDVYPLVPDKGFPDLAKAILEGYGIYPPSGVEVSLLAGEHNLIGVSIPQYDYLMPVGFYEDIDSTRKKVNISTEVVARTILFAVDPERAKSPHWKWPDLREELDY